MLMDRRQMIKSAGLGALALSLNNLITSPVSAKSLSGPLNYELPKLPYGFGDLAPEIDKSVLKTHYTKHHAGYVKGLNATLAKLSDARAAGDFSRIKALSRDLAFHGSGHILHSLYWQSMAGTSLGRRVLTLPTGPLRDALQRDFGSLGAFRLQFTAAANNVEGSGWALLVYEPMGRQLLILQVEKHQNLAICGAVPLLACDVWEHAYYDQYQNRRSEYVDNFYKLIDWPAVAGRFAAATLKRC